MTWRRPVTTVLAPRSLPPGLRPYKVSWGLASGLESVPFLQSRPAPWPQLPGVWGLTRGQNESEDHSQDSPPEWRTGTWVSPLSLRDTGSTAASGTFSPIGRKTHPPPPSAWVPQGPEHLQAQDPPETLETPLLANSTKQLRKVWPLCLLGGLSWSPHKELVHFRIA